MREAWTFGVEGFIKLSLFFGINSFVYNMKLRIGNDILLQFMTKEVVYFDYITN